MTRTFLLIPVAITLAAAAAFQFEPEARSVASGRSPKLVARRAHGVLMTWTGKSASGPGTDLFYASSSDLGDTFTEPQRVNSTSGEVSDHGENSPELLTSPDESTLYAVWNARDPKEPGASHVRFSRSSAMRPSWSPAITVNDDASAVSHGFQTAAVGPDGTIYAAWLDGRNRGADTHDHASHDMTGGTSDVYLARSTDGGKTFEKNVRVASSICPCCRPSIGFAGNRVLVAWRQVEPGDLRDIFVASSSDRGETWSKPALVARDGWKIKGCPHVGPSMASLGDKLYIAWFSEAAGNPGIYLAASSNGGESFGPKEMVSTGTEDPTHPRLAEGDGRLALVFQARDAKQAGGWGPMAVWYREIAQDGKLSPLVRAAERKAGASYPGVALGMSGRIFLGWTETGEAGPQAVMLRGRTTERLTAR